MYNVGIDIGGTKVIIGFLDEAQVLAGSAKYLIPDAARGEGFLPWLLARLEETAAALGIGQAELAFCGIGVPGTVSRDGTTVRKAPNLGWSDFPLATEFSRLSGLPVKLVQDSRAGAWGEYRAGAGRGMQSVLCVTLGTGIGTGLVLDGRIYDGSLTCAGELGHVPVRGRGRRCGCGKVDCLEQYVSGSGLTATARELLGPEATVRDLFARVREGDSAAQQAVQEAVELLGAAMVGAVNLLSPDCLLFSGGLSSEPLYLEPLMEYIRDHSYELTARQPHIGRAALGELAPMTGCALLPHEDAVHPPRLSASIMCDSFLHLEQTLRQLEQAGIHYIHYDMMDNHFVPNLMLPGELLRKMRAATTLPFDIHIMAEHPEQILPQLGLRPGDYCTVHAESTPHLARVLAAIRESGAHPAVALNPATPLESIREVLDGVDMVLIMTVNPGYAGQKLLPQALEKIQRTRRWLDQLGYPQLRLEVDGCCSYDNLPLMRQRGADTFVLGTSSLFDPVRSLPEAAYKIRNILKVEGIS